MFEVHFVQRHQVEAQLLGLLLLAEVVELKHAVVDDLRHSLVGDLVLCLAVDHLFDVGVEDAVHFLHSLYFLGDHRVIFLQFEHDFRALFRVLDLVDVSEAALVDGFDDSVLRVHSGTIQGVETLPLTVDSLNNFVHVFGPNFTYIILYYFYILILSGGWAPISINNDYQFI